MLSCGNFGYLCMRLLFMRVLIINTSDNVGGAAVATNRLVRALNESGVESVMFVRDNTTGRPEVIAAPGKFRMKWCFLLERLTIFFHLHFHRKHLWEVDIANSGIDVTSFPEFRKADVVHLSWINQGMLSLESLRRIIDSGKPVVWTMHDLWPLSSICHYARGCEKYTMGCDDCPLLPNGCFGASLAHKVWEEKKHIYSRSDINFVTCSRWLAGEAERSGLLGDLPLTSIPNPIDTKVFCPKSKDESKSKLGLPEDKKVILFVAQKVTDERKGASFFVTALNKLCADYPEVAEKSVVALLGGKSEELACRIAMPVFSLGYVSGDERLARVYNAADVFVLPSMEDNLPNTVMEALACGVPCVGFNVGGIPEMIDSARSGYIARAGDADDLAEGIRWVLAEADASELSRNAVMKVEECYSLQSVAQRYMDVYRHAIEQKLSKK